MSNCCYKLRQLCHKLRRFITNYGKKLIQIISKILLPITAVKISPNYCWLLQIKLIFITNYGSFKIYYKLRQKLLQIAGGIMNWSSVAKCTVTRCRKNKNNTKNSSCCWLNTPEQNENFFNKHPCQINAHALPQLYKDIL